MTTWFRVKGQKHETMACFMAKQHRLFILTNSFSADRGIKSGLGQKLAPFELPHINRIAILYGMTFFERT
jgi:hypothetical protein